MKTIFTIIIAILISSFLNAQDIKPAIQKSHAGPISEIIFLDGDHLSSFSKDGNAVLWDLKYEKVIEFTTGADEAGSFGFKNENISNNKHLKYIGRINKAGGELKSYVYKSYDYSALVKKNKIRFYKGNKSFSALWLKTELLSVMWHIRQNTSLFL